MLYSCSWKKLVNRNAGQILSSSSGILVRIVQSQPERFFDFTSNLNLIPLASGSELVYKLTHTVDPAREKHVIAIDSLELGQTVHLTYRTSLHAEALLIPVLYPTMSKFILGQQLPATLYRYPHWPVKSCTGNSDPHLGWKLSSRINKKRGQCIVRLRLTHARTNAIEFTETEFPWPKDQRSKKRGWKFMTLEMGPSLWALQLVSREERFCFFLS